MIITLNLKLITLAGHWWWCTPFIPALGRQRHVDLSEFKASLVYRVSSSIARATQSNPVFFVLKNQKNQTKTNQQKSLKIYHCQQKNFHHIHNDDSYVRWVWIRDVLLNCSVTQRNGHDHLGNAMYEYIQMFPGKQV